MQDLLLDAAIDTLIFDDQEVGTGTIGLGTNKHSGFVMSLRVYRNKYCE